MDLQAGQRLAGESLCDGRLREEAARMRETYKSSCLDRIEERLGEGYYFACGVQNVTKEAAWEHFPYGSAGADGDLFTADVILDNRAQMLREVAGHLEGIVGTEGTVPPDGEILYECFRKAKEQTLATARGAYACAYLERGKGSLTLFNDAVGNRSVYYFREGHRIYFSSLLRGILCERQDFKCNEGWFERFVAMEDLRAAAEPRETPYTGIYRLQPGEVIVFTIDGERRRSYWDPFATRKVLMGKTDEEYRELVTDTLKSCVEDVIRGDRETGILLSGGLDSNAVAAFAAPFLKDRGRKLYSFTSVPQEKERAIVPGQYAVEDERHYVELVKSFQGNLEPEYIVTDKGDLLAENRKLLEFLEVPYKAVLNLPWMYESYRRAAQKGCGILLSGQYGNITISYGDFRCLFLTLLRQGKLLTLTREIDAYRRKYRKSRRWIWKDLLTAGQDEDFLAVSRYMYDKNALRQVGEYEVKLSLATGVIPRDPTRDKRMIELVLSLPPEQFTHDGQERRLVRRYLRGYIPEKILTEEFHKGRQGVGSGELLARQWEQIRKELAMPAGLSADERISREQMVRAFYLGLAAEYQNFHYN